MNFPKVAKITIALCSVAVIGSAQTAPVNAKPAAKPAASASPRAEMNRFIQAIKARRIETMRNLVSPTKGLEITGLEVRNDYADFVKDPKTTWANDLLFTFDPKIKTFQAAREFLRIKWIQQGNKFVPSRGGKTWKKSEVWVTWQREKGAWKLIEVGTPRVGGDLG